MKLKFKMRILHDEAQYTLTSDEPLNSHCWELLLVAMRAAGFDVEISRVELVETKIKLSP